MKEQPRLSAREKMMRLLARRDHSEQEIRSKLRRFFEKVEIDQAIELAKQKKWLITPDKLSQNMAEMLHRKGKGYLFIVNYLKLKGLPAITRDLDREVEKAREFVLRFWQKDDLADATQKEKMKLFRQLKNRGFDGETIQSVFRKLRLK